MDRYVIIKKTIKTKFDEFMDHGRIIEENNAEEFFNHPKDERLKDFLSKVL